MEEVEAGKTIPDTYEDWLKKQVKARSGTLEDREEDIDSTEDVRKKARRRKRGRGAAASNP